MKCHVLKTNFDEYCITPCDPMEGFSTKTDIEIVLRKQLLTKYAVTENSMSYILVTHNQDNMTDTLMSVI